MKERLSTKQGQFMLRLIVVGINVLNNLGINSPQSWEEAFHWRCTVTTMLE